TLRDSQMPRAEPLPNPPLALRPPPVRVPPGSAFALFRRGPRSGGGRWGRRPAGYWLLVPQEQLRPHDARVIGQGTEGEAEAAGDLLHGGVVGQDLSGHALQALRARDADELAEQFGAEALALVRVAHQDGPLGGRGERDLAQAADGDHEPFALGVPALGDERQLAVVVDETDAQ